MKVNRFYGSHHDAEVAILKSIKGQLCKLKPVDCEGGGVEYQDAKGNVYFLVEMCPISKGDPMVTGFKWDDIPKTCGKHGQYITFIVRTEPYGSVIEN